MGVLDFIFGNDSREERKVTKTVVDKKEISGNSNLSESRHSVNRQVYIRNGNSSSHWLLLFPSYVNTNSYPGCEFIDSIAYVNHIDKKIEISMSNGQEFRNLLSYFYLNPAVLKDINTRNVEAIKGARFTPFNSISWNTIDDDDFFNIELSDTILLAIKIKPFTTATLKFY